jgi:uncharacterized protein DUF1801
MNMFMTTRARTPAAYIRSLPEPRRSEVRALHTLIRRTVPRLRPHIRSGMIGYGPFHYRYASGREGDWFIIGLASQKQYISVYVCAVSKGKYVAERYKRQLPKANIGKSCIRFRHLEDIDLNTLKQILREGARWPVGAIDGSMTR